MRESRTKTATPQFEALESLTYMSVAVPGAESSVPDRAAWIQQIREARSIPQLSGTIQGSYEIVSDESGGGTLNMNGRGFIRGLGVVQLTGQFVTDPTNPSDTMDLTLSNNRGSVTVRVSAAPTSTDPTNAPPSVFNVVSATDQFTGFQNSGTVGLTLLPSLRSLGTTGRLSLNFRDDATLSFPGSIF